MNHHPLSLSEATFSPEKECAKEGNQLYTTQGTVQICESKSERVKRGKEVDLPLSLSGDAGPSDSAFFSTWPDFGWRGYLLPSPRDSAWSEPHIEP